MYIENAPCDEHTERFEFKPRVVTQAKHGEKKSNGRNLSVDSFLLTATSTSISTPTQLKLQLIYQIC